MTVLIQEHDGIAIVGIGTLLPYGATGHQRSPTRHSSMETLLQDKDDGVKEAAKSAIRTIRNVPRVITPGK